MHERQDSVAVRHRSSGRMAACHKTKKLCLTMTAELMNLKFVRYSSVRLCRIYKPTARISFKC